MLIELLAIAALGEQTPAQPAPTVVDPKWDERPAPSWPRQAGEMGIVSAEVVTTCAAGPQGRIADCQVVSESPGGYGFGREVLASTGPARLAEEERVEPGAEVTFTTRFRSSQVEIARAH